MGTREVKRHEVNDRQDAPCLALRPKDAALALGIGERKLWTLTDEGKIPCVRLGRVIVYPIHLLRDWLSQRAEGVAP